MIGVPDQRQLDDDGPVREYLAEYRGRCLRDRCLPDPARASDGHETRPAFRQRAELGEVELSPQQRRRSGTELARELRSLHGLDVLVQDRALQRLQLGTGSTPSSSTRVSRARLKAASASAWRPAR